MIVLVGFMGAGKTTVGHMLAEKLGLPFVDSDLIIESRTGRSIREIFVADGEPAFRELEHEITAELLRAEHQPDTVVAVGDPQRLAPDQQHGGQFATALDLFQVGGDL